MRVRGVLGDPGHPQYATRIISQGIARLLPYAAFVAALKGEE
ncbi:hypothetical protein [Desulfolutivibrio sulfoxidireducens]|nr:hypothetical protein [Desulfolutivibrio sulfoxidireducens]